ncbi:MAG: hypothetical protein L3J16_00120 [Anaerolineales bacterium]|nr:hypothetical protein [Anaerolineales bacterium]
MFCGKTDELIRRLRRAAIARQQVQVFKPAIDVRYAEGKVTSHAGAEFDAEPVKCSTEILENLRDDATVIAIDEAQFFDMGVIDVTRELAERGLRRNNARAEWPIRSRRNIGGSPSGLLGASRLIRQIRQPPMRASVASAA